MRHYGRLAPLFGLLACDGLSPGFPDAPAVALTVAYSGGVVDRLRVGLDDEGCEATSLRAVDIYAGADVVARWRSGSDKFMHVDIDIADLDLRPPWPARAELYAEAQCESGVRMRGAAIEIAGLVPASQRLGDIAGDPVSREFHWDPSKNEMVTCDGVRYDAGLRELARASQPICGPQDQLYFDGDFIARVDRDRNDIDVYDRNLQPVFSHSGDAAAWVGDAAVSVARLDDHDELNVFEATTGESWTAQLPRDLELVLPDDPSWSGVEVSLSPTWIPAVRQVDGNLLLAAVVDATISDSNATTHLIQLHRWSINLDANELHPDPDVVTVPGEDVGTVQGGAITPGATAALLWGDKTASAVNLESEQLLWTRPSASTATIAIARQSQLLVQTGLKFLLVDSDGSLAAEHDSSAAGYLQLRAWDPSAGLIYTDKDSNLTVLERDLALLWQAYVPHQHAAFDSEAHPLFFDGVTLLRAHSAFEYRNGW